MEGIADYIPVFLSEIPGLIRKGVVEAPKIKKARKTKKEEKNRLKKVRGTAKVKGDKKKK